MSNSTARKDYSSYATSTLLGTKDVDTEVVSSATSTAVTRPSTPAQHVLYNTKCAEKKIPALPAEELKTMNYTQMSSLIQKTLQHYPATAAQRNLITELCTSLEIVPPTEEQMDALNGSRDSTASQLITTLKLRLQQFNLTRQITEPQVEVLMNMFLCPEIDFETIGVPMRSYTDVTYIDKSGVEQRMWIMPTANETANIIRNIVTQQMASDFINKNGTIYSIWKRSRATISQINRIQQLESRMTTLANSPLPIIEAVTFDGFTFNITSAKEAVRDWTPVAYVPLTIDQLQQLSNEDAKNLIKQLQIETLDKTLTEHTIEDFQNDVQDMLRSVTSMDKLDNTETLALQKFLHSMLAVAGFSDDALIASAVSIHSTTSTEAHIKQKKKRIKDFMNMLVQEKFITLQALMSMAQKSTVAWEIMTERSDAEMEELRKRILAEIAERQTNSSTMYAVTVEE